MSGGSQLRLSQLLPGTPLGEALHRAHDRGAVVGGTSAGASIMSDFMISMGEEGVTPRQRASQISAGLGLVRGVVVDQHFDQRSRYGRLMSVIAPSPHLLGIGIDEDTAIVVTRRPRVHGPWRRRRLRGRLHDRRHRRRRRPGRRPDARVRGHRAHPARRVDLRPRRASPHRLRRAAPRPARLGRRRQGLTAASPRPAAPTHPPTATRGEAPMDRPIPTGPAAPDLRIVESRVYRGGNIWSYDPSIHLVVDLGVLEEYPSDTLPGFTDRLVELLPGLENHTCSKGVRAASSSGCGRAPGSGTWPSTSPCSCSRRPGTTSGAGRPAGQGQPRRLQRHLRLHQRGGRPGGRSPRRAPGEPPGPGGGGLRLRRRAGGLPDPGRAHRVRPVDRGHPRGGGQPRHPLHPAQQRQPGAARPGRAPAADPRHDDVEDQRAGRRHRRRQGHDHQAARLGGPAGAQAGDGALGRGRGRRRPADRLPGGRQAARRQPRSRGVPQPGQRRRGARGVRGGRGPVPPRLRHRRVDGDRPRLPLPHRRWPDAGHRRAGARARHRRRHAHRRRAGRDHQLRPAPRRRAREGAHQDQGGRRRRWSCCASRATRSTTCRPPTRWSSWR